MMNLPKFKYYRPETVDEALTLLNELKGEGALLSGGTDLFVRMKQKVSRPKALIDIKGLKNLRYINSGAEDLLRIGALTTLREIVSSSLIKEKFRLLAEGAGKIGSFQIRSRGTIGGNICLDTRCQYYNNAYLFGREHLERCYKRGGGLCHLAKKGRRCYAVSSSDLSPILAALEAELVVEKAGGRRVLLMKDFFADNGVSFTVLQPNEMVTEVRVKVSSPHWGGIYLKARRVEAIAFADVGVAVVLFFDGDKRRIKEARIVFGSISSMPVKAKEVEERLKGFEIERASGNGLDVLLEEALRSLRPIPHHGNSVSYLRALMKNLALRGIRGVVSERRQDVG